MTDVPAAADLTAYFNGELHGALKPRGNPNMAVSQHVWTCPTCGKGPRGDNTSRRPWCDACPGCPWMWTVGTGDGGLKGVMATHVHDPDGPSRESKIVERLTRVEWRLAMCRPEQRAILKAAFQTIDENGKVIGEPRLQRRGDGLPGQVLGGEFPKLARYAPCAKDGPGGDLRNAVLGSIVARRVFYEKFPNATPREERDCLLVWLEKKPGGQTGVLRIADGVEREMRGALTAYGVKIAGVKFAPFVTVDEVAAKMGRHPDTIRSHAFVKKVLIEPHPNWHERGRPPGVMRTRELREKWPQAVQAVAN